MVNTEASPGLPRECSGQGGDRAGALRSGGAGGAARRSAGETGAFGLAVHPFVIPRQRIEHMVTTCAGRAR